MSGDGSDDWRYVEGVVVMLHSYMLEWCDIYLDFIYISHTYLYVTVIHHEEISYLYLYLYLSNICHYTVKLIIAYSKANLHHISDAMYTCTLFL